jgi:hypothetical protein
MREKFQVRAVVRATTARHRLCLGGFRIRTERRQVGSTYARSSHHNAQLPPSRQLIGVVSDISTSIPGAERIFYRDDHFCAEPTVTVGNPQPILATRGPASAPRKLYCPGTGRRPNRKTCRSSYRSRMKKCTNPSSHNDQYPNAMPNFASMQAADLQRHHSHLPMLHGLHSDHDGRHLCFHPSSQLLRGSPLLHPLSRLPVCAINH